LYRTVLRNLLATTTPVVDDQLMMSGVASVKFSCYDGATWQVVGHDERNSGEYKFAVRGESGN